MKPDLFEQSPFLDLGRRQFEGHRPDHREVIAGQSGGPAGFSWREERGVLAEDDGPVEG
jgi:hypothetical protein